MTIQYALGLSPHSNRGFSFEGGFKPNILNAIEPVDLRSGIKAELGLLFDSLNILFVRPIALGHFDKQDKARLKVDKIYEDIRVMLK